METKTVKNFKAVDFTRQVRNEMSTLYYHDKAQYHDELKKAMADFLSDQEERNFERIIDAA